MALVSPQNLTQPPPEYKNNTVLFSYHIKKVTLKPWVAKYLDSVPLKLKWELEYLDKDLSLDQNQSLLTRWESGSFQLNGTYADNVDTIFLLAQTIREKNALVLNNNCLKVSLVIDNSTNVIVGTCAWNLDKFKVRSRFNPHSFELTNENKMFIGYVDIFYVSQQRWVRINKASFPMFNKKETEYTSSPESNANTNADSEKRSDDDTTLSCSSFNDTESPFSSANSPREDYVLIFWNSTNTCFVKNNPNDIQLQLIFMFIKTCLIDGDSTNSEIPFQLEDIRPNEPFEVLKKFSSTIKQLSYKDAKHFMHIPHSHRGSSNKSNKDYLEESDDDNNNNRVNRDNGNDGDSNYMDTPTSNVTTEESNFEIQHSSRLYSMSIPSTERLLNEANINDPTSFYNFISKQNKHFQNLLTKRFLSPTSSFNPSTNTSSISDSNKYSSNQEYVKKAKYLDLGNSLDEENNTYNGLPNYAKSIDTVASYADITHKTTNTMTTGLVSYRNQAAGTIDEESLTIGDTTMTTTKTLSYNKTYQDKYNQLTNKPKKDYLEESDDDNNNNRVNRDNGNDGDSNYIINDNAINTTLYIKDNKLNNQNEFMSLDNEVTEKEAKDGETRDKSRHRERERDKDRTKVVEVSEINNTIKSDEDNLQNEVESINKNFDTKTSNSDYKTPSKSSITVYSIYSPKDYIENFSEMSESSLETDSNSEPSSTANQSPSNINKTYYENEKERYYYRENEENNKKTKINKYFKNVQNAYYIHDNEPDPIDLLSNYTESTNIKVNRTLHCERTLLNFETISKDLQTIGELKSTTDPELGSFDSSLVFKALQDAQILKVQGQTLPTSAYLKFFLKYLKCYNLKRIPIVVYLQIITFKQLETMKRLSSSSTEILNFINVALEALIYELQVSTSMNSNITDRTKGLLFYKSYSFKNKTDSDDESDNLFMFDSENDNVDFNEFEINSAISGDKYLMFQNIIGEISKEAQNMNTRNLVYISRLNSPPVKNRGCIFRISALKIVFYRTFCGRRKLLSKGHMIKI